MNGPSILLWGFAATIVLSITMAGSQRLGYTRMSIPFLLGTMMTPNRDRAMLLGLLAHMMNGWLFALLYPAMHPRMVSGYFGPTPNRQLQPPGFLALNYGYRTPIVTLVSHLVYGAILGAFYQLAER